MTVVANADSFALACRRLRGNYESTFKHRIAEVRAKFGHGLPEDEKRAAEDLLEQALEAHVRTYVVNGVLSALNWRIDSMPDDGVGELVPEAPIHSLLRETTRFLDYLGLERVTDRPLLIVETKRPSSELPKLAGESKGKAATVAEALSLSLKGESPSGSWGKWLDDLGDYVRSAAKKAGQYPRRAVLTNGEWFVIFEDPEDSFGEGGKRDPGPILVFEKAADVQARAGEFFLCLAHRYVVQSAPALRPGMIASEVAPSKVLGVMHGLRLRYSRRREVYDVLPTISVAPVLFLRLANHSWTRVEVPPRSFELPHDRTQLANHLHDVDAAAADLRAQLDTALAKHLPSISLEEHYADADSFAPLKAVVENESDDFLIATGSHSHYILETPTVPECPYHDSARANQDGVAAQPVLVVRSMDPRSFFVSAAPHYCAHIIVSDAKSSPITDSNVEQRGPRSGKPGHAFCEVFRFETRLCCRTCAFETVCTKAQVLNVMPCQRVV